jgi:hypothetical protein
MKCAHCNDTGSLTKLLWGSLDCVYCNAAIERATLNEWGEKVTPNVDEIDLWLIYLHGKETTQTKE